MEKTCKKCGETKPIEQFTTNGKLANGNTYYTNRCKVCHNVEKKIMMRGRNPSSITATKKDLILKRKKDGCSQCGYKEYMFCIDLHHDNPEQKHIKLRKVKRSNTLLNLNIEELIEELKICTPLCKMCHAKVHAGIIKL